MIDIHQYPLTFKSFKVVFLLSLEDRLKVSNKSKSYRDIEVDRVLNVHESNF